MVLGEHDGCIEGTRFLFESINSLERTLRFISALVLGVSVKKGTLLFNPGLRKFGYPIIVIFSRL
jgi:hypothetical protein